ncbi:hypothetical protein [Streptomyces wuyuanensis]|uniref:hypothetical protein n=1 Tax=Streptomyces wuyuanensis TaxID=1196353 RepID=UPI00343BA6A6
MRAVRRGAPGAAGPGTRAEGLRAGDDTVRAAFPAARVAAVDPYDIAAVAAVALTSSGHGGRAYTLSGTEALVPAEQVRILGRVLGRELRFEALSDEEARAGMEAGCRWSTSTRSSASSSTEVDESVVRPAVGAM